VTKGGLLVAGVVIPVEGMTVHNPLDTAWSKLAPGDYRKRRTSWVRHAIVHTTKGIWPQHVIPGLGPGGKDKLLADFYRGDPQHNGAHAGADDDGTGACFADIATDAAYQAGMSNDNSWGLEFYQLGNGGLYEAGIVGGIKMLFAGCEALGIPLQVHRGPYRNGQIIKRMRHGGDDCVGIFGHRDQSWIEAKNLPAAERERFKDGRAGRGRGDPGDIITMEIAADPRVEAFDFNQGEDLRVWERRQRKLRAMGEDVTVDGVAGPGTMAALRRLGFRDGRELDRAVERPE